MSKRVLNDSSPWSRFQRFAKRAGSPSTIVSGLAEEAFVRAWSHEQVRALARSIHPVRHPKTWVFLVGCFNSGTTLLQHILGAHPEIAGLPREGVRFTSVLSNLEANGHHMMWDENYDRLREPAMDPGEAYARIAADWSVFWNRRASIYIDKSVANTARVAWLDKAFPNAKFVGIHRNGYCIAEGLRRRAVPPDWYQQKTGLDHYPIEATGHQWVIANTDMLAGFDAASATKLVKFEDLVSNPAAVLADIFEFLDVDPDAISTKQNTLQIGGKVFDIRDPNPSSIARLSDDEKERVQPIIAPMMHRLGYEL